MKALKAYKYRLYPTKTRRVYSKTFSCVRLVYNLMLQDRIDIYKEMRKILNKRLKCQRQLNIRNNTLSSEKLIV